MSPRSRRLALALRALTSAALGLAAACGANSGRDLGLYTRPDGEAQRQAEEARAREVLDAWHAAAAASDEETYFGLMSEDAIFLGTDATERWTRAQFREYAHAPFSQGRGWRMRAVRRDMVIAGAIAWFDEDLETANLGPARGSGVLVRDAEGHWRIAHYNLTVTVPNERFEAVRDLLSAQASPSTPRSDGP